MEFCPDSMEKEEKPDNKTDFILHTKADQGFTLYIKCYIKEFEIE